MATATTAIYTYLHTLALHDALPIFIAARYLAVSGAFAWATRIRKPGLYRGRSRQIRREFSWSLTATAIYGLPAGVAAWGWQTHGWTRIYTDMSSYPLWWWPASIVLYLVLHDGWFYWTQDRKSTRLNSSH